MKKLSLVLITLLLLNKGVFSQQSHVSKKSENMVYPMVIFQPNEPQSVLDAGSITKKISFQLYASENFKENFSTNIMKNRSVVSCNLDKKAKAGAQINMDLSPEVDFDYLKTLLKDNGVLFVSIEDTLLNIDNWRAFTQDEMRQIKFYNTNIYNFQIKRNWVLEHEAEKKQALENGWMKENTELIQKEKRCKSNY